MSGNVNVNKNASDPNDNVIRRYNDNPPRDYKNLGILIIFISIPVTVLWLIFFLAMKIECYWSCGDMMLIFRIYNGIIGIAMFIGLLAIIPLIYQAARNSAFIRFRGVAIHRDDLRSNPKETLNVALESAKSEATAGIDTYSPSISNSSREENKTVNAGDKQLSDEIALTMIDRI